MIKCALLLDNYNSGNQPYSCQKQKGDKGMLTLGRNSGEYIVLEDGGRRIVIQVAEIDGVLRLVVDAPRDVKILRGEVYEKTNPAPDWIRDSYVKSRRRLAKEKAEKK